MSKFIVIKDFPVIKDFLAEKHQIKNNLKVKNKGNKIVFKVGCEEVQIKKLHFDFNDVVIVDEWDIKRCKGLYIVHSSRKIDFFGIMILDDLGNIIAETFVDSRRLQQIEKIINE